jgi:hypothetical protein
MTWNQHLLNESTGEWGGPWTEKKLDAFSKYVWSYLTILNKYPMQILLCRNNVPAAPGNGG